MALDWMDCMWLFECVILGGFSFKVAFGDDDNGNVYLFIYCISRIALIDFFLTYNKLYILQNINFVTVIVIMWFGNSFDLYYPILKMDGLEAGIQCTFDMDIWIVNPNDVFFKKN